MFNHKCIKCEHIFGADLGRICPKCGEEAPEPKQDQTSEPKTKRKGSIFGQARWGDPGYCPLCCGLCGNSEHKERRW